jgi:hypothetical protein
VILALDADFLGCGPGSLRTRTTSLRAAAPSNQIA